MRGQRTTSSAASSAEGSPRFLSYRQATTPCRPSVALLPGQPIQHPATVSSGGGARLREPWPSFGDAIRQSETADTIFGIGIRKRNVVSRATVINGRPTTLVTRPTASSLARRLQSEPGIKGAVSPSSSSTSFATATASASATPDNAARKKVPHRLSPTALDWIPRANTVVASASAAATSTVAAALSPHLSSLSYADVARIGDGRPPPPFPILRKVINPRARHATSTGTIVRPGANSSIATSRGSEIDNDIDVNEMDDGNNSDKENNIAPQETGTTFAMEMDPLVKKTPDNTPSCHGLGDGLADGLGFLGQNTDEGVSIGISDDIAVELNFTNGANVPAYQIPARRAAAHNSSLQQAPVSLRPSQSTPGLPSGPQSQNMQAAQYTTPTTNTPDTNTPSSHAVAPESAGTNSKIFDTLATEILEKAEANGFGGSPFLPTTGEEYRMFERERANDVNDRHLYEKAQRAQERERLKSAQSTQPGLHYAARQFRGGKDVQDSQARLDSGLGPGLVPTMQAPFQPVDGSSSVLGQFTTFSDGPEVFRQGRPSYLTQHIAPWPGQDDSEDSGITNFHTPPELQAPALPVTQVGQDNTPRGWDWISQDERMRLMQEPSVEIEIDDTHGQLQNLIEFIDKPEKWYQC